MRAIQWEQLNTDCTALPRFGQKLWNAMVRKYYPTGGILLAGQGGWGQGFMDRDFGREPKPRSIATLHLKQIMPHMDGSSANPYLIKLTPTWVDSRNECKPSVPWKIIALKAKSRTTIHFLREFLSGIILSDLNYSQIKPLTLTLVRLLW